MKKILLTLISILSALMLFACGFTPAPPSGEDPGNNPDNTHTHEWSDWTVAKQPTCMDFGEKSRTCSGCEEIETERITVGDHSFTNGECTVCGSSEYTDGLTFEPNEGGNGYRVTGVGSHTGDKVVIPTFYEGKPVTEIAEGAFRGNTTVKTVIITVNITIIGDGAFEGCTSLTDVEMPKFLDTVGNEAFSGCTSLTELKVPDKVTEIGSGAFRGCTGLKEMLLPDSAKILGEELFYGCVALIEVHISINLRKIPDSAFKGCSSLTTVNIPTSAEKIGASAFEGCSSLTMPTLPPSVSNIDDRAFAGCTSIESAIIPDTVEYLGDELFADCEILIFVKLPAGIMSLGSSMFSGCDALNTLTIPNAVETVLPDFLDGSSVETVNFESNTAPNGWEEVIINIDITITVDFRVDGGHVYSAWQVVTEPTCSAPGVKSHVCVDCGHTDTADIPKLEHVAEAPATCTEDSVCSVCGALLEEAHHTLIYHDMLAPTCNTAGNYAYEECSECDYTTYVGIAATGVHDYNLTAATCTEAKYCKSCSAVAEGALGHNIVQYPAVSATCTEPGRTAYESCSRCDYATEYTTAPARGHTPSASYATCTNDVHCTVCSTVITAQLAHSYNSNGVCTSCGAQNMTSASESVVLTLSSDKSYYTVTDVVEHPPHSQNIIHSLQVTIPDYVNGIPVKKIDSNAFKNLAHPGDIFAIIVPETVTELPQGVFANLPNLNILVIPFVGAKANPGANEVKYPLGYLFSTTGVNNYAYAATSQTYSTGASSSATRTTTYYIPTALNFVTVLGGNIPAGAFMNCHMQDLTIENSAAIGARAFENTEIEYDLMISDKTKSIAANAFTNTTVKNWHAPSLAQWVSIPFPSSYFPLTNSNLYIDGVQLTDSLQIPEGITSIPYPSFAYASFTSLTLPQGLVSIGNYAFYRVPIQELTLPVSLETIGIGAFYSSGIREITLPEGIALTSIGDSAFGGTLTSLKVENLADLIKIDMGTNIIGTSTEITLDGEEFPEELVIDGGITQIGAYAFSYIPVKTVTILGNIDKIGSYAFYGNSSIISVTVTGNVGNIGASAFQSTSIQSFTANGKVTAISANAFYECDSLTSVKLTVEDADIGQYAFYSCDALTDVEFIGTLGEIGTYAFKYCAKLKNVSLGERATTISAHAFYGCTSLEKITIPEGVTYLGNYAFNDTPIKELTVPASLNSAGGTCFGSSPQVRKLTISFDENSELNMSELFGFAPSCLEEITVIGTHVPFMAFRNCTSITKVTLEGTVDIGRWAFMDCSGITEIAFPDTLKNIDEYAFDGCGFSEITLPESLEIIYDGAFNNCANLTRVNAASLESWLGIYFYTPYANPCYYDNAELYLNGEKLTSVTTDLSISAYAFYGLSQITDIDIGAYVGTHAFYGCTSLKTVSLDGNVGTYAFYGCTAIETLTVGSGVKAISSNAFTNSEIGTVKAGSLEDWISIELESLTSSPAYYAQTVTFNGEVLTSLVIPESITVIKPYMFAGISSLTEVTVHSGVTSIGVASFAGCNSIEKITLPYIGLYLGRGGVFECIFTSSSYYNGSSIPKSLKTIIITDETYVGDRAFRGASSVTEIILPESVERIGNYVFMGCDSLERITLTWSAEIAVTWDDTRTLGYLFEQTGTSRTGYTRVMQDTLYFLIPNSLKSITVYGDATNCAFQGMSMLESVTLLGDVTTIGNYAFYGCSRLTAFTIPEGVTSIGDCAFSYCYALTDVTVPEGVTSIGVRAFEASIDGAVSLPSTLTSIGDSAFESSPMTSLSFGEGTVLKYIGRYAFRYTSRLTEVALPEFSEEATVGDLAFYSSTVNTVSIPHSALSAFGSGVFSYCYKLTSVSFGEGEGDITIPASIFKNCTLLSELTIPEYVTGISNEAFSYSAVTELDLSRVSSIGYRAFYYSGLTAANLAEGLTSIGSSAFAHSMLTSVTLPASLSSIGSYIFEGCTSLTYADISRISLDIFGGEQFKDCSKLTDIVIPEGVTRLPDKFLYAWNGSSTFILPETITEIGQYTFAYSGITSITIPASVTVIENNAFYNCKIKEIRLASGSALNEVENAAFNNCSALKAIYVESWADWCKIDFANATANPLEYATAFYVGGAIQNSNTITIPEGITYIGSFNLYEFPAGKILSLPSSLHEIGAFAFMSCDTLTDIIIPGTVKKIGEGALADCGLLRRATLPYVFGNSYEPLGYAFSSITSDGYTVSVSQMYYDTDTGIYRTRLFHLPSNLYEVTINGGTIPAYAFYNFGSSGIDVKLAEGITAFDKYAFAGSGMNEIRIPSTVTYIGDYAFSNVNASIYFPNSPIEFGGYIFAGSNMTSFTVPASITSISENMFAGCTKLVVIVLHDGITEIGANAFSGCTALESVTIPAGVTEIGAGAFNGCYSLTSVNLPSTIQKIHANAFNGCSRLQTIVIPDGVTELGAGAFRGCSSLTTINIPAGITVLPDNLFYGCSRLTEAGITFSGNITALGIRTFAYTGLTEFTVPAGVTALPEGVFEGSKIIVIIIHVNVTELGASAFRGCTALTEITLPEGIVKIPANAFDGCSALATVNMGGAITEIGEYAFRNSAITAFTVNGGVGTVSRGAFMNCKQLEEITISEGVTEIGDSAFEGCTALTGVTVPQGARTIGSRAFYGCSSIIVIVIYDGLEALGDYAFYGCTALEEVSLPEGLDTIGNYTFYGCTALEEISLPEGLDAVGSYTFYGCTSLSNITLPDSVALIGNYAFFGCTALTEITLPVGVITVGERSFSNCSSIVAVIILGDVNTIGAYAFSGCTSLVAFTVPRSVTVIENGVFSGCTSLVRISTHKDIESFGAYAFENCISLSSIVVPEELTAIGSYAFYGCKNLTSVYNDSKLYLYTGSSGYGYVAYYADTIITD